MQRYVIPLAMLSSMLLTALPASASWTELDGNENMTLYADLGSIRREGPLVRMWVLYDRKTAPKLRGNEAILSFKALKEFDCTDETHRNRAASLHSGRMGSGRTMQMEARAGEWAPVTLGTMGESAWNMACTGKKNPDGLAVAALTTRRGDCALVRPPAGSSTEWCGDLHTYLKGVLERLVSASSAQTMMSGARSLEEASSVSRHF